MIFGPVNGCGRTGIFVNVEKLSNFSDFEELDLLDDILDALDDAGYEEPTPIQQQAIPPLLEGRDVLGIAQTGTGKTAAFSLPVLQHIAETETGKGKRRIRALIVTPTRELAAQIGESMKGYGKYLNVKHTVIFGGVKQGRQVDALRRGVDILIATPGRLLDLENQGHLSLSDVDFFVLDEADRMLDMGFINDIKKLLKLLPKQKQNLLFSATMPESIEDLAGSFLSKPVKVEIAPEEPTVEAIEQKVMFTSKADKKRLLPWIVDEYDMERAIVFTRTKHGANRLVKELSKKGVNAAAIHGNKSQNSRTRALQNFKDGEIRLLVATDIASRGIDIDELDFVVNYDLPNEEESYVHRIGRTGRAGRDGIAISFCEKEEGAYLRDIERLIGFEIEVDEDHPYHDASAIPSEHDSKAKKKKRDRQKRKAEANGDSGQSNNQRQNNNGNGKSDNNGGSKRRRRRGGRGRGSNKSNKSNSNSNSNSNSSSGNKPKRKRSNPPLTKR